MVRTLARNAAAVALVIAVAGGTRPLRVDGSIPTPDASLAPVLEAQGELVRARPVVETAPPADAARARVRLARRNGDTRAALAALARADFPANEAALLYGAYYLTLAQPESALAALAAAPPPPNGLEGYAAFLTAEAASVLGRWETASAAAIRAREATLPSEMEQRLLVVRGLVARATGDRAGLEALAPQLGDAARRDDRTGLLLLDLADSAARSGDAASSDRWLRALLEGRPTPAESAYVRLRDRSLGFEVALEVARFESRSGRRADARVRLARLAAQSGTDVEQAEAYLALADVYMRDADYAAVKRILTRAEKPARGTRFEADRLRLRARAERRSGARDAAIGTYRELARRFPAHALADDALYEVGWLNETRKSLVSAERAYLACERTYRDGSLADDALLRAGLCALRDGRAGDAAGHFRAFETRRSKSSLLDNVLYWHMLAQLRLNDGAGALALRDRLERDHPRSYFTVLARERVERGLAASAIPAERGGSTPVVLGDDTGVGRARRVDAAYAGAIVALRDAGVTPPRDFAAQTRLWRFLLDGGLATEALWEARRLERVYDDNPGALLELIAIASARGAHERLVRCAYLLGQRAPQSAPREALDVLSYPAPYSLSIAEASAQHGLAHATVLGLMRQESAFDPAIDSGVGARGLLQLMPEVGKRLWRAAGKGELHPDALYQPPISIALGTELLAAELERSRGDLPQALAAYNAGGDVAETWRGRLGPNDPAEMYLDLAEYAETRNFLEAVLGNAAMYRRLYALP